MATPEAAMAWLGKQQLKKETALCKASRKPNATGKEIDDILGALDVIEYLADLVRSAATETEKE